jgi:hypothetical protein
MRRLTAMFVAFLSLVLGGAAAAQDFSGTYAAQAGAGPGITLILRQNAQGQVTGTLSGNTQFQIQAQAQGGQVMGYAVAPGGRLFLQGQLQGGGLVLALAEVGPDGQPQPQTARTVMLSRTGGADAGGSAGAMGAAPTAPGRRGRAAGSAVPADPYVGTFSNGSVTVTLTPSAQGYTGTASAQGQQMPLMAQNAGDRISGAYQMNGVQLPFQAQVQGDAMVLATNDGTFQLQRTSGAAAAPGGMGAPGVGAMGGAGGAGGGIAATGQDGQISQLLLSGAWCFFSYSQTSGTSHTERVVFRGDGSGAQSTGGETYNSGPNGSVAGQSQGGQQFRWRVQGGMLVVTGEDGQSSQVPLRITRNSSGSPIVTAGGKEYARCN